MTHREKEALLKRIYALTTEWADAGGSYGKGGPVGSEDAAMLWPEDVIDAINQFAEDNNAPDKQPDPITGLVPCGCGGEVYPHYQLGWYEESGVQAFDVSTGCDGCGTYTKPRRGHYVNGIDEDDTESASKWDWNTSRGYTAPSRPGAKEQSYES